MEFCYTSWQTDRYLDELGKWERITENYHDYGPYDEDFVEFKKQWAKDNPDDPPATEAMFQDNIEYYVDRWVESMKEVLYDC